MSMTINPARCAVIAMDFQPNIMGTLPNPAPSLAKASEAIASARAAGAIVGSVRVAFTAEELREFPAHSAMGNRMRTFADKVMEEAPTTQVSADLGLGPDDIAVRKIRVGPFGTTDLAEQLKTKGVDTLVLAGIHTSGCVLTAVREAHDLDFRVIVLADASDDPDPAVHTFLTEVIFPKQSEVMNVADFTATLMPGVR